MLSCLANRVRLLQANLFCLKLTWYDITFRAEVLVLDFVRVLTSKFLLRSATEHKLEFKFQIQNNSCLNSSLVSYFDDDEDSLND